MQLITKFTADGNYNHHIFKQDSTIDLGVYSPKTALLLNFLFSVAENDRPTHQKYSRYYGTRRVKVGGGLLFRAEAKVMIDDFNKVTVYFFNDYVVGKYIRVAEGKAEIQKSIKDKIANELKKTWKNYAINDKIQILVQDPENKKNVYGVLDSSNYDHIDYLNLGDTPTVKDERNRTYVEISLNEYRALYEFLKGRDTEKIKERNGVMAWDSMIGKPIEDQFVLSAIETIQAEIEKVKQECDQKCDEARSERDTAKSLADKIYREKTDTYAKERRAKIEELKAQMADVIKMGNMVSGDATVAA